MVKLVAADGGAAPPVQYTAGFLAGSFGLTLKQARDILARSAGDRTAAAELARQFKAMTRR